MPADLIASIACLWLAAGVVLLAAWHVFIEWRDSDLADLDRQHNQRTAAQQALRRPHDHEVSG